MNCGAETAKTMHNTRKNHARPFFAAGHAGITLAIYLYPGNRPEL
jgi:hypothetical protein